MFPIEADRKTSRTPAGNIVPPFENCPSYFFLKSLFPITAHLLKFLITNDPQRKYSCLFGAHHLRLAMTCQKLAQHVSQDASMLVIENLLRSINAYQGMELDNRAI